MATATPTDLTDRQWAVIAPLLPPRARTGRPRADDRKTLNGILWVLRTGARWADLPRRYGAPSTCHHRLTTWQARGVWERLWRALLSALDGRGGIDWQTGYLDGTFVTAKRGGEAVGPTRRGKGTKVMAVVDGRGLPLGLLVASAREAEVTLAEPTLATIRVPQHWGRPKTRPRQVVADKGYDSAGFRRRLRSRGIRPCIPYRRGRRPRPGPEPDLAGYRQRWRIERTFAWLGSFRRLLVRFESSAAVYRGLLFVAAASICLGRLVPRPSPSQPGLRGVRTLDTSLAV